jgi:hypothetical protein
MFCFQDLPNSKSSADLKSESVLLQLNNYMDINSYVNMKHVCLVSY